MNKKILIIGALVIIAMAVYFFNMNTVKSDSNLCTRDYIMIDMNYTGDNFSVNDKSLEQGCVPNYRHDAGFRYSYDLEGNNKSLYQAGFSPTLYSDNETGGDAQSITGNVIIDVPSTKDAEKVNVYDNGSKILEVEVKDVGATSCRI